MSLVEQLTYIYLNLENWHHGEKLSKEEADRYHQYILENGLCITVLDGDILSGYCEYWRLTYESFGRIICGEYLSPLDNEFRTGYIAFVANTYIRPEYRNTNCYKQLRNRFFEINKECIYFSGIALRKKHQPVKVFKREAIFCDKEYKSKEIFV